MADQDHRAVLAGEHPVGRRHFIGECRQRILNDADVVAAAGENVVDALPAGAVGPGAVDENDVLDGVRRNRGAATIAMESAAAPGERVRVCDIVGSPVAQAPSGPLCFNRLRRSGRGGELSLVNFQMSSQR